jgi:predicted dehydrogenase
MNPPLRVSRRCFLGQSATLAAGIAVPYLIPSGLLAARPNDRIGVAGIGIGRQGSGIYMAAAGSKQGRAVAVADANIRRAEAMAARLKVPAYQDYRKLLERRDVDAVTTATPDHWRSLVSIHACQAGKDVYAEKPLTLTIHEGRLMVDAARKYQRVFQTGTQQRSALANRVGCELVRTGKIGKILKVIAHNYPSPWECKLPAQAVPEGLDWDLWCGPVEPVPYNLDLCTPRAKPGWISFRPFSGGEMTGWGAHGLDQVQCALGMDDGGPIEVWTEGKKFDPPTYVKPESRARGEKLCSQPKVFFRYPGGIVVEMDAKGPAAGGTFVGEKGTITIDRELCKSEPKELAEAALAAAVKTSASHMENWLDCIKSRQKPAADVEIGHRSATVCHLGNIARWAGRKLAWDPVKEIFPDDPQANAYLDRPRRKPYLLPEKV